RPAAARHSGSPNSRELPNEVLERRQGGLQRGDVGGGELAHRVGDEHAARRSAGSTARCTIPAATSWLTSVLTVLPARCRLRAAAATPTPGSSSTSCHSSSCAPRSAGPGSSARRRQI